MTLVALIGAVFLLLALRVPISFSLLIASMGMILWLDLPMTLVVTQIFSGINSFTLLAIPFFMLLGRVLNEGQMTARLVAFADTVVGHIRGGLGHVNVFVSMVFSSLSGSASADTASVGALLIPAMQRAGYSAPFAAALTAASSTMGNIIPPSIIMVIYGAFGQVSIGALFLGGIVPGLMLGLGQMAYVYVMARRQGLQPKPFGGLCPIASSMRATWPVLLIPAIVLGGIVSGTFTPTEAASIAAAYAILLALFVYRLLRPAQLPVLFARTVTDFSVPLFAIACAGIFGWLISFLGAGPIVARAITGFTDDPYVTYACLIGFLLLIGTFLSPMTAVVIFMPIIQSIGAATGFHPVHIGVTCVMALTCGLLTPPYGICVLIAAQISGERSGPAFVAVLPLIGITVGLIAISAVFPDLVLGLPRLFMPEAVR